jgi:hypothetical protein
LAGTREGRRDGAARHALGGGTRARCRIFLFTCQTAQSSSFPRALLRPGFAFLFSIHPERGASGAPKGAVCLLSRVSARDGPRLLRRGASHGGGTLASRRSTVAILGRGPRFHLRHFLRIRAASSSQPGRSAWRAGSRTSRGLGYEPRPQDATPRSAFRIVSRRRPSMSEDVRDLAFARDVVNLQFVADHDFVM